MILGKDKLEALKKDSYSDGDANAKISWIEYSDIQCPYCAKLHNSGVIEALAKRYGSNLNRIFQHFPIIQAHANALPAAQLLECAGEI
jgi:protein-disulfide isomerase